MEQQTEAPKNALPRISWAGPVSIVCTCLLWCFLLFGPWPLGGLSSVIWISVVLGLSGMSVVLGVFARRRRLALLVAVSPWAASVVMAVLATASELAKAAG